MFVSQWRGGASEESLREGARQAHCSCSRISQMMTPLFVSAGAPTLGARARWAGLAMMEGGADVKKVGEDEEGAKRRRVEEAEERRRLLPSDSDWSEWRALGGCVCLGMLCWSLITPQHNCHSHAFTQSVCPSASPRRCQLPSASFPDSSPASGGEATACAAVTAAQ